MNDINVKLTVFFENPFVTVQPYMNWNRNYRYIKFRFDIEYNENSYGDNTERFMISDCRFKFWLDSQSLKVAFSIYFW